MDNKLRTLVESNHVPHALVIDSGTYEDRLAYAKELAAAIICDSAEARPCYHCTACKKIMADCHPDVSIILPEDKKKTLSVDIIRKMSEDAYLLSNEAAEKIYIIAKGEAMQDYAQNALLKILEEPPRNVYFIILCTTKAVLLPTVLSRTAVFEVTEKSSTDENDFSQESIEIVDSILRALVKKNEFSMLVATSHMEKSYDLLPEVLEYMQFVLRDSLILQTGAASIIGPSREKADALAKAFSPTELLNIEDAIKNIVRAINIYSNKNLTITRFTSLLFQTIGK